MDGYTRKRPPRDRARGLALEPLEDRFLLSGLRPPAGVFDGPVAPPAAPTDVRTTSLSGSRGTIRWC